MDELVTIHSLSEHFKKDPRQVEATIARSGVQPVAQLCGQNRKPFLWNREDAIKAITQGLIEASKR